MRKMERTKRGTCPTVVHSSIKAYVLLDNKQTGKYFPQEVLCLAEYVTANLNAEPNSAEYYQVYHASMTVSTINRLT